MSPSEAAALLGVSPGATEDEIRRAARLAAFRVHPDRGGSDEQVARVLRARAVLLGEEAPSPPSPPAVSFDAEAFARSAAAVAENAADAIRRWRHGDYAGAAAIVGGLASRFLDGRPLRR